ncbi:MAG: hypothetical protein ACJA1E_000414 [Paracoccaceae bacterium]
MDCQINQCGCGIAGWKSTICYACFADHPVETVVVQIVLLTAVGQGNSDLFAEAFLSGLNRDNGDLNAPVAQTVHH